MFMHVYRLKYSLHTGTPTNNIIVTSWNLFIYPKQKIYNIFISGIAMETKY